MNKPKTPQALTAAIDRRTKIMMRSLFSGVSGLKVHQTRMDVIGNNIANVNTAGFKSSNVVFSDILYQTTQAASGPNNETGAAGQNAKQIGLGSNVFSIKARVDVSGSSERTDNPFDVMISGSSFFIVNNAGINYFTKSGSFCIDAAGTLCTPAGYPVMGWQANDEEGYIIKDTVSALRVMSKENLVSPPEATTVATLTGNIDQNDKQLAPSTTGDEEGTDVGGKPFTVSFYDNLGNTYTARFAITTDPEEDTSSVTKPYNMYLTDILKADGKSALVNEEIGDDGKPVYTKNEAFASSLRFGASEYSWEVDETTGTITMTGEAQKLNFNRITGEFAGVGEESGDGGDVQKSLKLVVIGENVPFPQLSESNENDGGMDIYFNNLTQYSSSASSSIESQKGDLDGNYAGRKKGEMTGISIDASGKLYGTYDNGIRKLLGQIAVASFANPSGLESVGDTMFAETQNSGEFDGIGKDVTEDGGKMATGVLEMSNVDLSSEFTSMIITQRGFQSNSRIITTSDTLLEELINLKR